MLRHWDTRKTQRYQERCSGFEVKSDTQVFGDDAPALEEKDKKREITSPSSGQISPCKG